MKTIIKNINLLNIILISIMVLFATYILFPVVDLKIKYTLPAAKKTIEEEEIPVENQIPSITEYTKIVEENLFHPERKIPPEKKEEQSLSRPEFVLYGTLIADDIRLAYLEDLKSPRNTPGRGKRQITMRKGDTLSGYTLKEIEPEKVLMVRGEENIVVRVIDTAAKKGRGAPQPQSAPHIPTVQKPAVSKETPQPRPIPRRPK